MHAQRIDLPDQRNRLRQDPVQLIVDRTRLGTRHELAVRLVGAIDKTFADKSQRPFVRGVLQLASRQAHEGDTRQCRLHGADDEIGKLSIVGAGMKTSSGVSAKLFGALAKAGINIEMISTSEIRISVVTRADQLKEATRIVHTAFDLDAADTAIIYAGTGR